jgi:hypothetical protein
VLFSYEYNLFIQCDSTLGCSKYGTYTYVLKFLKPICKKRTKKHVSEKGTVIMAQTTFEKDVDGRRISLDSDWDSIYVAGEWVSAGNRRLIKDKNPYTGE